MSSSEDRHLQDAAERLSRHPCFNPDARHRYARIHLPVAPRCNMQCNYCLRRYSCVNESRPGVTCAVLRPGQAIDYLRGYVRKNRHLSVVGIAGPGDPMACASETLETLRMVRAEFPDLLLCIASNGLNLPEYADDLAAVGLSHVTITVNAVDPRAGARFYKWIEIDGRRIAGEEAAAELWSRQQRAIRELTARGTTVKINTIYTPGINDEHIETIAKTVSVLGASILNIMPLLPTAGTAFATLAEPDRATLQQARKRAGAYLPQMAHCARCRADAAGMIGEENMAQQNELLQIASRSMDAAASTGAIDLTTGLPLTLSPHLQIAATRERPYVAVASREGLFVNQHLGEAAVLRIYQPAERRSRLVDMRSIDHEGDGAARWLKIVETLKDCSAVLVSGAGAMPRKIFAHYGITVAILDGAIDDALAAMAQGGDLAWMAKPGFRCSDGSCSGDRGGCE
jgi:nitrogen fixation protein NifB